MTTTHLPALMAGVPNPDDPADVPKALTEFAGAVNTVLVAHDAAMAATVAQVNPDHIVAATIGQAYAAAWFSQGGLG